jgi:hypothetical protein
MKKDTEEVPRRDGFLAAALLELRELASSGSLEMGIIDKALGKFGIRPWVDVDVDEESRRRRLKKMLSPDEDHCRSCGEVETELDGLCELCEKCSLCCPCGTYE